MPEILSDDFDDFLELPNFDDDVEISSGVGAETGSTFASDWLKVMDNLTTEQKILLVTIIPTVVLVVVLFFVLLGCCVCRRQQRSVNDDVEVIFI